jgi:predicted ester cyclase
MKMILSAIPEVDEERLQEDNKSKLNEAAIRETIERYYYKAWNKCDEAALRQMTCESVKFRGAFLGKRKLRGKDVLVQYMVQAHSALHKYSADIDDIVVDVAHRKASVRVTCRGIHRSGLFFGVRGSGHEVSWSTAAFFTLSPDCRTITDIWVLGDLDSVKHQLGADQDASAFFDKESRDT